GSLAAFLERLRQKFVAKYQGRERQRRGQEARRSLEGNEQRAEADERAKRKADAERRSDQSHAAGPLVRRRAVSDHGLGRANGRAGYPRADAGDEQQNDGEFVMLQRSQLGGDAEQGVKDYRSA